MDDADYIIVGAGTAGCVLANRLSADGRHRVLLLEAGGNDRSLLIRAPGGMWPIMRTGAFSWRYRTAPQPHLDGRVFTMPRGKVLGGSSSTNGMVYSRGHLADYADWAADGLPGWSQADVLPWLRQLETHPLGPSEWHGADGPMRVTRPGARHPLSRAFLDGAAQAGLPRTDDTDGALREGAGPLDLLAHEGRRWSTATGYLDPVRDRANLRVVTHAHALRLLADGRRIGGVEYLRGGRVRQATATGEVIVCGGAFQSPQLLQLSGIGPAGRLRELGLTVVHDLPGVGAGLRDHVAVTLKMTVTQPITLLRWRSPWRLGLAIADYLLRRRGPLSNPGFEVVAFLRSRPDVLRPDLRVQLLLALMRQDKRGMVPAHGFQLRASLARPTSVGSVRLASADPLQPPVVDQNYLSDPGEVATLREAVRILRRICAAPAFDPYRGEELEPGPDVTSDAALDAFIRARADPDYHSVGTCRMGHDSLAVVDDRYRVHGVTGLRVADASVMPRIVDTGTCVPTILLAERAAAAILAGP